MKFKKLSFKNFMFLSEPKTVAPVPKPVWSSTKVEKAACALAPWQDFKVAAHFMTINTTIRVEVFVYLNRHIRAYYYDVGDTEPFMSSMLINPDEFFNVKLPRMLKHITPYEHRAKKT